MNSQQILLPGFGIEPPWKQINQNPHTDNTMIHVMTSSAGCVLKPTSNVEEPEIIHFPL